MSCLQDVYRVSFHNTDHKIHVYPASLTQRLQIAQNPTTIWTTTLNTIQLAYITYSC